MQNKNKQLVLREDDYYQLNSYLNGGGRSTAFERGNVEDLQAELKKAKRTKVTVLPPGEKLISYLNHLGQQYPFCVNFKCKLHDPL